MRTWVFVSFLADFNIDVSGKNQGFERVGITKNH